MKITGAAKRHLTDLRRASFAIFFRGSRFVFMFGLLPSSIELATSLSNSCLSVNILSQLMCRDANREVFLGIIAFLWLLIAIY